MVNGSGPLTIVSISRLEPSKRINWLINALSELEHGDVPLSARVDWRLSVIGDGSQRKELEQLAVETGLSSRIRFHGFVSDEEAQRLTRFAGLFVMPATQGYGLPALEFLARGVPVILHRDSGVSEILEGSPWVRILSSSDGSDLSAAINAINEEIALGSFASLPLPLLPSESEWASRIAQICGWNNLTNS
jgi:glycosyltransferase involved in cell wall biosynthesis